MAIKPMTSNSIVVMSFEETKIPKFVEKSGKDWILYGDNNLYPQELITMFNRSAKHNAIVTGKSEYILGQGIKPKNEADVEKFKALEFSLFGDNGANNTLYKIALDLELFNGYALEMIPSLDKKRWKINHIDFSKIRSNKDGSAYYYSEDWSSFAQSAEKTGLETYKPYRPNVYEKSILYFKSYRPKSGLDTYPLPDYIGCMAYIECDYQISNFHVNNLRNGFTGATIINFFTGEPTPEEQKSIERKLKKKFSGTDNAGGIVLVFSDSKSKEPRIENILPSDFDKQFDILNKTVQQEIFTGHKVTSPALFGIRTESAFSKTEVSEAYQMFQNVYIRQRREKILTSLDKIVSQYGITGGLEFINLEPTNFEISQEVMVQNMTREEIRQVMKKQGIELIEETVQEPQDVVAEPMCSHFSEDKTDDEVLEVFSRYGRPAEEFNVVKTKYIHKRRSLEFGDEKGVQELFIRISKTEAKILSLIESNPLISVNEVAEAIKISSDEALAIMEEIRLKDLVQVDEASGKIKVSDIGKKSLDDTKVIKISSMYQYGLSPYVTGKPIIETTREFCERLITLNRLYTRNDLNAISREVGYDVWVRRGGFYRNPKTGITTPFCRHVWEMKVVTER